MKKYILQNKGLLIITLLLGTIFAAGSAFIALILRDVIDIAIARDLSRFTDVVIKTAIYLLVLGVCFCLYSALSKKFTCKVTRSLRYDAFKGIFKKNVSDFESVNSADYLSALTNDVKNIEDNYFTPLLVCLQHIIVFIVSFIIMLYLSPLVLLCLFAVIILLVVIPGLFKGAIQKRQDDFSQKQSGITIAIKDFLSGFEVIRSYRMGSHILQAFADKNDTVYHSKYGLDKIVSVVEALSMVLGFAIQCSVMFVAAYLIITGDVTAGTLVALIQVSGTIVAPIQVLSQNIPKIQGCKPIIERLNGFVNYQDSTFTGTTEPTFNTGVAVQGLHFGYLDGQEIIKGIDFTFDKGKKYAIVGKSGCGKTTLINLLTGCYADFSGKIMYDGIDMQSLNIDKLSEMSSVIHQNVYMFDESIKDNICLHKSIKQQDLQSALQMSGVDMFLDGEKTLDTSVGENGNNLSGGQRQRVAVARALVQEKPILILDEGTSAVDMQTAYDIESQLLKLNDLTVITITHSLNPELLRGYNEVVFMDGGNILEADTFDRLVETQGAFYDFYCLKK